MGLERILNLIESVKDYSVLFIGDTIIDEYHYVQPLGKSAKENLIPCRFLGREVFDGGVDAAASHLKTFCKRVEITSTGPVTRKIRMVDQNYTRKLFELHKQDGNCNRGRPSVEFDCLVVCDFGHGEIRDTNIQGRFVAVSAQTNSANHGYNLITKYKWADYIVIDEPEARLAAQDRDGPMEEVITKLAKGRAKKFIITHGRHGAWGYEDGRVVFQKSFPERPVDTMGAGDAFFAVTAPMAKTGCIEDLLVIGHAAGTLKCSIIGHRRPVEKQELINFLKTHANK